MKDLDCKRSITSVQIMAEFAAERGMPFTLYLEGSGLAAADLGNPDLLITGHQELRVVANLVRYFDNEPGLGLEVGARYHFTSIGVLGLAIVSSPSMRAALELILRYRALTYAFTPLTVEDDGNELRMIAEDSALPRHLQRFLVERHAAIVRTFQRETFPATNPLKGYFFRFAEPPQSDRYEQMLGVRPVFGAPRNVIVADSVMMSLPSSMASEASRRMAEEQCRRLLASRKARSGYSATVRDCIIRSLSHLPTMDAVAGELKMNQRTLRRRLLDEGTTFAALLDEVRETLAEELLSTPGLTVESVAEQLGYSASSSFILAFRRWKGEAPSSYRRRSGTLQ